MAFKKGKTIKQSYLLLKPSIISPIDNAFNVETLAFKNRVIADGGYVEDVRFLDQFISNAKAYNCYNDIVAAYSPSWGVKGTTTASKLYSTIGAATDLSQSVGAAQPAINISDLNGKTRLSLDGIDDHMNSLAFTFTQPETIILMGYETESWINNDRVFDGNNVDSMLLYMNPATPALRIYAGAVATQTTGVAVGSPVHLRTLFNSTSSAIQVDNAAEIVSDAGTLDGGGFWLGRSLGGALYGNFSIGAVILLNSAVDANYATKMAAIYNFSKAAYGTP